MPVKIPCAHCGKPFERHNNGQRYCCPACKSKAKRLAAIERAGAPVPAKKACAYCGKLFERVSNSQRFCGQKCATLADNERRREAKKKLASLQSAGASASYKDWRTLALACEAVMEQVAACEQEIEWLNCQLENALTASAERMLMDAIADKQALIIEQAAKIAELQGKLASAAIEKPVKSVEAAPFANLKYNCCERLKLKQISALPCGKRDACFRPDKCKHAPKGATLEKATELTKQAMSGAPLKSRDRLLYND